MFTGIIEACGVIEDICPLPLGIRLLIQHTLGNLTLGESIAVNGVCLTVTDKSMGTFMCDVSPETLDKSTFADLIIGQAVSLERALMLQSRLGGHFVLGHVDDILSLDRISPHKDFTELTFSGIKRPEWLVEKGCIAIDGISLTVNKLELNALNCMIIPHSLSVTHLHTLKESDRVNVEYDYLAKIAAKQNAIALTA